MSEYDLITNFFSHPKVAKTVSLGIGDDAALITVPSGYELATSIDTLVAGVNFPDKTSPQDIGYKSIAVSLSDMAAMGAEPTTALLSLTLPRADEKWLTAFSSGLFELIDQYDMQLIGGDITRGPLSITTVVNGFVPRGQAILRGGARVGDVLYVTGTLGDAGLALIEESNFDCLTKLNRPIPRVKTGIALRNIASAAIDISDGLAIDLEKLCSASQTGASVNIDQVPLNKASIEMALSAGDDFELCFTVPPSKQIQLEKLKLDCSIQKIGTIISEKAVEFIQSDGLKMELKKKGYEHF